VINGSADISHSTIRNNRILGLLSSVVGDLEKINLKDNVMDTPLSIPTELREDFEKRENLIKGKSHNPASTFNQIPPHHFELQYLKDCILKLLNGVPLTKPMFELGIITSPKIIPPRITPDHHLLPTTIRRAWQNTDERSAGKVFVGFTVCPVALMASIMTVLVDTEGTAIFVALYNLPGITPSMTLLDAQNILPVGSRIIIKEPFLRRFVQDNIGIRVDSSDDVSIDISTRFSRCHHCGKECKSIKKCSVCGQALYCNKECQRADWKPHKIFCSVRQSETKLKLIT
jgi:hypothetical protein